MDTQLLLAVAEEAAQTIQDEAKEVLGATSTPLALVTGTLIAGAKAAIKKGKKKHELRTGLVALGAAVAAVTVSVVLIFAMWDVFWRSLGEDFGAILVGYWIAFFTVIGVAAYSAIALVPPAWKEFTTALSNRENST